MKESFDDEREKMLLHSLKDVVLEEKTKLSSLQTTVSALGNPPTKTSDLTNDSGFITNANLPTKTSDLTNDSGFLTAHQDISGKENTANKTTSISANPDDTKYPTEKAVADYVANNSSSIETDTTLSSSSTDAKVPTSKAVVDYVNNNIPQNYDTIQNMQISEIQAQIQNLGGTILLNQPEIADGTRLTTVAEISALNNQFDTTNFNTSAHEKLPFTSKGSNGPTAVVFFRQAPFISLTPTIVLQFFLRDIPSGTTSLACNITLNNTVVSSTALTVVDDQTYQATITLSNLTTSAFNKLEIAFNDSSLANVQLDYLDISITNTQNCIILNRDDSFSINTINTSNGRYAIYSSITNGQMYYDYGYNKTFTDFFNPSRTYSNNDPNGYSINIKIAFMTCGKSNGFITLSAVLNTASLLMFSSNNILYHNSTLYNEMWYKGSNFFQASMSYHNGSIQYSSAMVNFIIGVKYDYSVYLIHGLNNNKIYQLQITSTNIPNEFINVTGIQDNFMRQRTTYVDNIGYFAIHKSGNILYFPQQNSPYCIKIGKGRQVNAYLSEDALNIVVYYNLDNQIIKKTLIRSNIATNSNWILQQSSNIFLGKDFREIYQENLILDNNLIWSTYQ